MQSISAIYDGKSFVPKQPIPVTGMYEVVITFVKPTNKKVISEKHYLLEPNADKIPTLGRFDGLIEIGEDFNEPLEDLREYMF